MSLPPIRKGCGTQYVSFFFSSSRYTASDYVAGVTQATKHTAMCPHRSLSYCFKEAEEVKSALHERETHPTYTNETKVCRKSFTKRQAEVWTRSTLSCFSFTPPQAHSYQLTPLPWPKTTFIYMSIKMEIPHTQKSQMKAHGNPMYNNEDSEAVFKFALPLPTRGWNKHTVHLWATT